MTGSHVSVFNRHSSTSVTVITTGIRARSASLSLTLSLAPPPESRRKSFQTLPTEIVVRIIELASAYVKPPPRAPRYRSYATYSTSDSEEDDSSDDEENEFRRIRHDTKTLLSIALTCQSLSQLAHMVLYRNVRVSEPRRAELFARTIASNAYAQTHMMTTPVRPATMLGKSVTRLVLDCVPSPGEVGMGRAAYVRKEKSKQAKLSAGLILNSSALYGSNQSPRTKHVVSPVLSGLQTLVLHTDTLVPVLECIQAGIIPIGADGLEATIAPTELILDTFIPQVPAKAGVSILPSLSRSMSHFRILNPPETWRSPADTIAALSTDDASITHGKMTHLAIPRRANANEENDVEFVEWVRSLLSAPSRLESVVVSIFLPVTTSSPTPSLPDVVAELVPTFVWSLLTDVARTDSRLCVVPGMKNAWSRASTGDRFDRVASAHHRGGKDEKVDFWTWARECEEYRKSMETSV